MPLKKNQVLSENKKTHPLVTHQPNTAKQTHIEDELRESEAMFKIVVDSSPMAIYLAEGVDQKGIYLNPKFTELFGYTLYDIPSVSHWFPLAYPDPIYRQNIMAEWKKRVMKAQKNGKPIEPMEAVAVCKDGSKKDILWNFHSVGNRNISYGLDLTESKKAEEEHRKIDKAKSEFVALASHQLRSPLSAVKWYANMLLMDKTGQLNEKQKRYLDEIYRGNERMISLVNSLMDVSRTEMGTFAINPHLQNIIDIYKEVMKEVEVEISKKRIKIAENIPEKIEMMVDSDLMYLIFQNLLTNAVKYTPDGGEITVTVSTDDLNVLIAVKDTGYGIPEDAKDKIFTKLFRADNIVSKVPEGTGTGLYITKSIIEQAADGKIWVNSKENEGTVFHISLPLRGMKLRKGVVWFH